VWPRFFESGCGPSPRGARAPAVNPAAPDCHDTVRTVNRPATAAPYGNLWMQRDELPVWSHQTPPGVRSRTPGQWSTARNTEFSLRRPLSRSTVLAPGQAAVPYWRETASSVTRPPGSAEIPCESGPHTLVSDPMDPVCKIHIPTRRSMSRVARVNGSFHGCVFGVNARTGRGMGVSHISFG